MMKTLHYILLVMVVVCFAGSSEVLAQRRYYEAGATSRVDAYGNASPVGLDRRPVAMFQNGIQKQAFRNYQDDARRTNRRGGTITFALGADAVQLSRARRNQLLSSGSIGSGSLQGSAIGTGVSSAYRVPVMQSDRSRSLMQIYSRYGGFSRRDRSGQTGDITTLFARRYELLQATTLIAPVRRANMLRGGTSRGAADMASSGPSPLVSDIDLTADSTVQGSGQGLDVALMASLDRRYDEAIARGWNYFKNSDYQHAGRAFESASAIDSKAIEPRVAEIFCLVATGAMRTATVSLSSLTRRIEQPFDVTLDMRGKFASEVEARRIVLQTQLSMRANTDSRFFAPIALHTLVLWYSGESVEAAQVAKQLVKDEVPVSLRNWPKLIAKLQTPTP